MTQLATTIIDIRQAVDRARSLGKRIGFVPTMGALHEGHEALLRAAALSNNYVVVSIFVNPTQFGPSEDFARYPRSLEADRVRCAQAGADMIFAPSVEEMYPPGAVTTINVGQLGDQLCGASRPGHFQGVCTVVLKLLNIVQPDTAHFGSKDYQQARIITQMVTDLNVPVRVQIEPTVRDVDGLALSSRNRYLTEAQRSEASRIYKALERMRGLAERGERDAARLQTVLYTDLASIPGARVDYARIVDATTLMPVTRLDSSALAAVAVFLGETRLIDNILIANE